MTGSKRCSTCKEEKPIGCFGKNKARTDGFCDLCKDCRKEYRKTRKVHQKEYRERNKEVIAARRKKHYQENRLSILARKNEYRQKNKSKIKEQYNEYYKKNKGGVLKRKAAYRKANPDKITSIHLKYTYGVTLVEYDEMFESQNGNCAICGLPEINKRLAVDHCHKTGTVRSLLCNRCNTALGMVEENENTLLSMINYIQMYNTITGKELK